MIGAQGGGQTEEPLFGTLLVIASMTAGCDATKSYTPAEATQHGDVVVGPGGRVTNLFVFTRFLRDVNHHKLAAVQIVNYTTEGDPILISLSFDGRTIRYTFDNSQDRFGGQHKRRKTATCLGVSDRTSANGTMYFVVGCQDPHMPSDILLIPSSEH
jgi:hypothetical protein